MKKILIITGALVSFQAFSQEAQRPPTINELQGSIQVLTMQRDFAQQQAQSAAAQAMEMAAQLKAAKDELAKLKEPKK